MDDESEFALRMKWNGINKSTYLLLLFLASNSCRDIASARLRNSCFTSSSVRQRMTRRYGTLPCHLPAPAGADSQACCWSCSSVTRSLPTSAAMKAIQSSSRTGFESNHSKILGLFQLVGRGLGKMSYNVDWRLISRMHSWFLGRIEVLGSFDHGSFSNENRAWTPSLSFKPIK